MYFIGVDKDSPLSVYYENGNVLEAFVNRGWDNVREFAQRVTLFEDINTAKQTIGLLKDTYPKHCRAIKEDGFYTDDSISQLGVELLTIYEVLLEIRLVGLD